MLHAHRIALGKSKGRYHLGDIGVDGKGILKWILKHSELDLSGLG
jgi:hypothetical protein